PSEAELARSKAQLKAGLLIGLESSSARAEQMARQLLLFDRLIATPELIERIDSVTPEATRVLAARLVGPAQPSVVVVGAGRAGEAFARTAAERVRVNCASTSETAGGACGGNDGVPGISVGNRGRGRDPRPAGVLAPSDDGRLCRLGRAQGHEPPAFDRLGAAMGAR